MDLIKHFWYLIHVEGQKETITVQALTSQMTPLKRLKNDACFGYFKTILAVVLDFFIMQNKHNTYIVVKYKINLHSLRNRHKKLDKGTLFYPFLKLVETNNIFTTMYVFWIYRQIVQHTVSMLR